MQRRSPPRLRRGAQRRARVNAMNPPHNLRRELHFGPGQPAHIPLTPGETTAKRQRRAAATPARALTPAIDAQRLVVRAFENLTPKQRKNLIYHVHLRGPLNAAVRERIGTNFQRTVTAIAGMTVQQLQTLVHTASASASSSASSSNRRTNSTRSPGNSSRSPGPAKRLGF